MVIEEGTESAPLASGVPERYEPDLHAGSLIEAEHLTRYRWASELVTDKVVLDAGCGVGYGSNLLAEASRRVVGVDLAEDALAVARSGAAPGVEFVQGDITALPLEPAGFDAVVSFEAIEHVEDPARALAECARVLRPGGLLIVSTPNAAASPGGNPHHLRELHTAELEEELRALFANVRVLQQRTWFATALVEPPADEHGAAEPSPSRVYGADWARDGTEFFAVALASNGPLPEPRPAELALWQADGPFAVARMGLTEESLKSALAGETTVQTAFEALYDRLGETTAAYEEALQGARGEAEEARAQTDEARRRLEETRRDLDAAQRSVAALTASPSWRLTAPLRAAKHLGRRGA